MKAGAVMTETAPSCWNFIVSLYAKPEVKSACLALQNMGGIDVPILLCALYASAIRNIGLGRDDIREMDILSSDTRNCYIRPLRAMRTSLKANLAQKLDPHLADLRSKILDAELAGERAQLAALERFIYSKPAGAASIQGTTELVCAYYFHKNDISTDARLELATYMRAFPAAVSSSG
jgi:uncharacterized protein (TIGR02444 family)